MSTEQGHYGFRRLNSLGTSYTKYETLFVLDRRISMPEEIIYDGKDAEPRISTRLDAAEREYKGGWYMQGAEGTCGVWATINAMKVTGAEPDVDHVKELLNHAISPNPDGEDGISLQALEAISKQHDLKSSIAILPSNKVLEHLPRIPYPEDPTGAGIIFANATAIQKNVTENSALVVTVPSRGMSRTGKNRFHAVCVAGYTIDSSGFMDVQVIDSSLGVSYKSLEGFSRQLPAYEKGALIVRRDQ